MTAKSDQRIRQSYGSSPQRSHAELIGRIEQALAGLRNAESVNPEHGEIYSSEDEISGVLRACRDALSTPLQNPQRDDHHEPGYIREVIEGVSAGSAAYTVIALDLLRDYAAEIEAEQPGELERLRAIDEGMKRARASFGHRDGNGLCGCVICQGDIDGILNLSCEYEMRTVAAEAALAAAQQKIERLKAENIFVFVSKCESELEAAREDRDFYDRAWNDLKSAVLRAVPDLPDDIDWVEAETLIRASFASALAREARVREALEEIAECIGERYPDYRKAFLVAEELARQTLLESEQESEQAR